jgi:hypothetical protein
VVTVLAVGALLVAPSSASGAVEFGSPLTQPSAGAQSCSGSCTFWNTTINTFNPYAAPTGGVVVSFTLRKAAGGWAPLHLRVVEPVGLATEPIWRGLTSSSPDVTPSSVAGLETFPVRIPIAAGDYVAIEFDGPALHRATLTGIFGAVERAAGPKLPAGGSPADSGSPVSGYELLLRARIEADADSDGFGDETQDKCPTSAKTQAACAKKCKKKKPKKGGNRAAASAKKKTCKKKKKKKRRK